MVAGVHLYVAPGVAALGDRLLRFKARWIDEADKSEQLDARHDVVERDPHCIRWHLLRAKCEDALALVSSVRDGILPIADVFGHRSEEHTSELQSLMRISYAVFCLKKKKTHKQDFYYNFHHNESQTPTPRTVSRTDGHSP